MYFSPQIPALSSAIDDPIDGSQSERGPHIIYPQAAQEDGCPKPAKRGRGRPRKKSHSEKAEKEIESPLITPVVSPSDNARKLRHRRKPLQRQISPITPKKEEQYAIVAADLEDAAINLATTETDVLEGELHCCKVCRKTFSTKEHLDKHSVIHSDAKPFQCE